MHSTVTNVETTSFIIVKRLLIFPWDLVVGSEHPGPSLASCPVCGERLSANEHESLAHVDSCLTSQVSFLLKSLLH